MKYFDLNFAVIFAVELGVALHGAWSHSIHMTIIGAAMSLLIFFTYGYYLVKRRRA